MTHIVGSIMQCCRLGEPGDEHHRGTHQEYQRDGCDVGLYKGCGLCGRFHFGPFPSHPTVLSSFSRRAGLLARGSLRFPCLPGVATSGPSGDARRIQSRGRLRLRSPFSVRPVHIPISSPNAWRSCGEPCRRYLAANRSDGQGESRHSQTHSSHSGNRPKRRNLAECCNILWIRHVKQPYRGV